MAFSRAGVFSVRSGERHAVRSDDEYRRVAEQLRIPEGVRTVAERIVVVAAAILGCAWCTRAAAQAGRLHRHDEFLQFRKRRSVEAFLVGPDVSLPKRQNQFVVASPFVACSQVAVRPAQLQAGSREIVLVDHD
ncbi:hypothetical protein WJ32_08610 [Burkholderia ubonensis]|uniref:Uncharacterized protein n=1 Tax=Burkholderia ubonensis TaxID=101571 RepID=A0A118HLM6_9BURK|nr:hypothetical protein WJ32_08610 [Burkholderia ubonensis]KVG56476.1 hypothetical protein WJ33_37275 [Burkholderia ubonensis]